MNPYGVAAIPYFDAGFSPLPALGKLVIVKHASGRYPIAPRERVEKWTRTHSPFNIALRLPNNVMAFDIDAYKGDIEKLEKLESELGKLPTTWNSDSRGGDGGKLLFRIPDELASDKWESNISGITIVQHTHRYVMVLPSMNKETNSRYKWYTGLGGKLVSDFMIPMIKDLAELPKAWADALRKTVTPMYHENSGITNDDLDIFNDADPCPYMQVLMEMACVRMIESYDSNVHDTALSLVGVLVRAACEGHSGIVQAIDNLSNAFVVSPRNRDLGAEWNNILSFVLANVETDSISEIDSCALTKINWAIIEGKVIKKLEEDAHLLRTKTNLTARQIRQRLWK